uniref:Uncharacterized protein n=1 Tax=Oryza nivara TaxID=4536 RepID=A0A0E0GV20_ORYNI
MEENGVIYFMLNAAEEGVYMVSLNMHTKNIMSSTRLSSCPTQPLGVEFPKHIQNPVPPKRDRVLDCNQEEVVKNLTSSSALEWKDWRQTSCGAGADLI